MTKIMLNNGWRFSHGKYSIEGCDVPFSMYSVLLENGLIDDPFYRDNEYKISELSREDSEACLVFSVTPAIVAQKVQRLSFLGADTVINVSLNDEHIGRMSDMHRRYDFDVAGILKEGKNVLTLHFESPVEYTRKLNEEFAKDGLDRVGGGHARLRKVASMNGWDWGPRLPDMGIYKDVCLTAYSIGELTDVDIRQTHNSDGSVTLALTAEAALPDNDNAVYAVANIVTPSGDNIEVLLKQCENSVFVGQTNIDNPELWWPVGYGKQPLYNITVALMTGTDNIGEITHRIGLRTVKLCTEDDEFGKEFAFEINGTRIFAMGGNYIPEDNLIPRITEQTGRRLIKNCLLANFNMIRVWGGGYYLPDYFMDMCDECGLLVWHDFMFACSAYLLTDELRENIIVEADQNLRRLRSHPSLALMCGNNEIEQVFVDYKVKDNARASADYVEIFCSILPEAMRRLAPEIPYWQSSPWSGKLFENTGDPERGDVHNWDIWHGSRPFREYRKHHFRFCSEYGFEAFPNVKTIESFTREDERNPFCRIMDSHQKCWGGNGKILMYLSQTYLFPSSMENLVYASQLLQGDAIRYGVEHFRRDRGRCMGSLYWQLNDCWPTSSWASIDYFGRWKGLHYAARNFYAPVLISAHEDKTNVTINISNETMSTFAGTVTYGVRDNHGVTVFTEKLSISVEELSSLDVITLDLAEHIKKHEQERFFFYRLCDARGVTVCEKSVLFQPPKYFEFCNPEIAVNVMDENGRIAIKFSSKAYAKGVFVDFTDFDCTLSDNYFDLLCDDTKTVYIIDTQETQLSPERVAAAIKIKSVYDMDK